MKDLSVSEVAKLCFTSIKHWSGFVFFIYDHCVWMNKAKLSPAWMIKHEKLILWRSIAWRVMVEVGGLPAIVIDLVKGYAKKKQLENDGSEKAAVELEKTREAISKLRLQAQKSFFDMLTYWTQVPELAWTGINEKTGFHSGYIGWAGVISTISSLQLAWRATK